MSESPFNEPNDIERTVIRPRTGGSQVAMRAASAPGAAISSEAFPGASAVGNGPLAAAASPVLQLLARLQALGPATDPAGIQDNAQRELRIFERRAHVAGVPAHQILLAKTALCAALDDIALHAPWGRIGAWRDRPLSLALHENGDAGAGFFAQLRMVRGDLPGSMPVMELMFTCLSLGMKGPYRGAPDGEAQMERLRHQVFGLIAEAAGPAGAPLSTNVQAVTLAPAGRHVPFWVWASAALAGVAVVFLGCRQSLMAESETVSRAALAAAPASMPVLVRPAPAPHNR